MSNELLDEVRASGRRYAVICVDLEDKGEHAWQALAMTKPPAFAFAEGDAPVAAGGPTELGALAALVTRLAAVPR